MWAVVVAEAGVSFVIAGCVPMQYYAVRLYPSTKDLRCLAISPKPIFQIIYDFFVGQVFYEWGQGAYAPLSSYGPLHTARCIARSGCLKGSISDMRDVFCYLPLMNSSDMAFVGLRHGKSTRR